MIPLNRHNLIIKTRPQRQPKLLPLLKMVPRRHTSARPLTPPHTNELLKRRSPVDTRRVPAGILANIIYTPITRHCAKDGLATAGVVFADVFENVVLDEGRACPAVDGQVGVAVVCGVEGGGVGYGASMKSVLAWNFSR